MTGRFIARAAEQHRQTLEALIEVHVVADPKALQAALALAHLQAAMLSKLVQEKFGEAPFNRLPLDPPLNAHGA